MFQITSNPAPAMDFKEYSAHWVEQPTPEALAAAIQKFSPDSQCNDGREIAMAMLVIIGEAIPLFEAGKNREEVIAHLASKGLERNCAEPMADKAKSILDNAENEDGTASIAPQPSSSTWKLWKWIAAVILTIGVIDFFRTPPIEQQDCDYSAVKLRVRELIAYRISEIARPAKDRSRATGQVQLINSDSVRLQDIRSHSTPRENRGKDIFYSCSASASIKLAPTLHDRLSQSAFVRYPRLRLDAKAVTVRVMYVTGKRPGGSLGIGLMYQDPLVERMLGLALQEDQPEQGSVRGR